MAIGKHGLMTSILWIHGHFGDGSIRVRIELNFTADRVLFEVGMR